MLILFRWVLVNLRKLDRREEKGSYRKPRLRKVHIRERRRLGLMKTKIDLCKYMGDIMSSFMYPKNKLIFNKNFIKIKILNFFVFSNLNLKIKNLYLHFQKCKRNRKRASKLLLKS